MLLYQNLSITSLSDTEEPGLVCLTISWEDCKVRWDVLNALVSFIYPAGRGESEIFQAFLCQCSWMPDPNPPPSLLMVSFPHDAELKIQIHAWQPALSSLALILFMVFLMAYWNCSPLLSSSCPWLAEIVWPQFLASGHSNQLFASHCKRKTSCWHQNFKACSEKSCDLDHHCRILALYWQEIKLVFCTT